MGTCLICKLEKPDAEMRLGPPKKNGKGRYKPSRCISCDKARQRERYSPERERKYRASRYAKDANYKVKQHLSHNYGITLEQYDDILSSQDGRCAICRTDAPDSKGSRFHIDHCHSTGEIRGLLCANCNAGVGRFKDDPERLEQAARYLRAAKVGFRAKRTYRYGRQSGHHLHP